MKTMMVLALIVLVAVGVWSSPKGESDVILFEAALSTTEPTVFCLGVDKDGKPNIRDEYGEAVQLVTEAKLSDIKTPEQIWSSWVEFQNLASTAADVNDFSVAQDGKFDGLATNRTGVSAAND